MATATLVNPTSTFHNFLLRGAYGAEVMIMVMDYLILV